MKVDTKMEIRLALHMLSTVLIKNNVSMSASKSGDLLFFFFFDTETYVEKARMNGFKVKMDDLVNGGSASDGKNV